MSNEDALSPADRLRLAREQARNGAFKTGADAARFFGWDENTYKHHENGIRNFPREKAIAYARAFGVTPGWLLFGEGTEQPKAGQERSLPQKNNSIKLAAVILPIVASSHFSGHHELKKAMLLSTESAEVPQIEPLGAHAFVFVQPDDSMIPFPAAPGDFFPKGTYLVLDPEVSVDPGDFVLVKICELQDAVFRKYRDIGDGAAEFIPLNSNFRTVRAKLNAEAWIIARLVCEIRKR